MKTKLAIFLLSALCLWACEKDKITTDSSAMLEFSSDSIFFDTVFTSVGSTTRRIKVYNRGKYGVKISQIKLAGGAASNYQININGVAGNFVPDIELAGKDSLNIFVKVTINPNSDQLPFIVNDSIEFTTNGNYQKVVLTAYGQNAVFLKDLVIDANTVWNNSLPYVIYNSVKVNTNQTLTIQKGSRIYFHKNAQLKIAGTLKVNGTLNDSISFSSDRLEKIYQDEPGQWGGLHFLSTSRDNHINYAYIKNAVTGVRVDSLSLNSGPKLLLTNSIIKNMELAGLYLDNTELAGFNNLIANCGRHLIYAANGGRYNLKQNTFVNAGSRFPRTTPSLFFSDFSGSGVSKSMDLTLINNIIWGNLADELLIQKSGTLPFSQIVRKNLIKSRDTALEGLGNILNLNPMFKAAEKDNFSLSPLSPAGNKGEDLTADTYFGLWLSKDLNGKARLFPSDLGSYEIL
ncbi:MAG: hypothetical protein H7Y13_00420 [Sphingobacteriaceae bacterium]|nr:hypothetical protein [Sphingobacteriaceae bacterium]